ncbi:MAG: LL-diaminopimelate aminotransferase [Trueperaceae bacterium]|nr:LL-diaminopimelate aminotransferase [Trueperaceae bacterium]
MTTNRWMSKRARAMPASVFDTMDRAKGRARAAGLDIIDLSVGSSDLHPPQAALEALRGATHDPKSYGYCLFSCTAPLRHGVSDWFERRFKQRPDPDTEVLPLIGSQEGLANLLFAVTDPGDVILAPDPGYPSYYGAIALAGLELSSMPLTAANDFLPDLGAISAETAAKARVMLISYPNNPTAAVAPAEFMQRAVDFCRRHDILLVHDFPYVDMTFGDYRAPSVLTQIGAMDTAIELYSCSKSFHMGGFRIGWAVGNAAAVAALAQAKSAIDFNQYLGIQRAALAALNSDDSEVRAAAETFEHRCEVLVGALNAIGWDTPLPRASMYVWTSLPRGFNDSFEFALALAETTGVCLSPGRAFGEYGRGYVRFALVRDAEVLEQAAARIETFLAEHVKETGVTV